MPDGYTLDLDDHDPADRPAARPERVPRPAAGRSQDRPDRIRRRQGGHFAETSLGLLDRVAGTLLRCGDVGIEVAAHADSDGSASKNRDLTQARAEAVVDYLVDAGVRREQLTAVGYGEDNPIADNSTAEGKRANRRIEFLVSGARRGLR